MFVFCIYVRYIIILLLNIIIRTYSINILLNTINKLSLIYKYLNIVKGGRRVSQNDRDISYIQI